MEWELSYRRDFTFQFERGVLKLYCATSAPPLPPLSSDEAPLGTLAPSAVCILAMYLCPEARYPTYPARCPVSTGLPGIPRIPGKTPTGLVSGCLPFNTAVVLPLSDVISQKKKKKKNTWHPDNVHRPALHSASNAQWATGNRSDRKEGARISSTSCFDRPPFPYPLCMYIDIIISGSACSTGGVHSQAWSTLGIGIGSKSGRG
jgi:hypothetical protein